MSKPSSDSDSETEASSLPSVDADVTTFPIATNDAGQTGGPPGGRLEAEEAKLRLQDSVTPKPDVYGQVHPDETPDLVLSSLSKLEEELKKLTDDVKVGWEKAKDRCPSFVGDDHKLMFLRCEVFHADRAAFRLVKYWNKRIEIFGDERAFLPLTLDGALKDDIDALIMGFVRTNERMSDSSGRRLIFLDPSLLDRSYDRRSMNRATWYVLRSALEDEVTQKRGIVMVVHPRNASLGQFDRQLLRVDMDSIKGCIPVRVGAFHVCHPPIFAHLVLPVIKLFIGPRLSSRFRVHSGTIEAVLGKLDECGISKGSIPSDIGGSLVLDQDLWLADRRVAGL